MSYADGEYPTCTHEAHVTRDDLERWWEACSDANLRKPMPPDPAKQARRERFGGRDVPMVRRERTA